ncbi:DUF6285 domain-containing protein [Pseudorhodoferax sp. Leaf265]|uniref:DUF6285 domain-containing protein n=1 Tax=Pseudorhodoferax sp. Leaf265 TaxID=1736315 RepID=UPI0006FDDF11|nr:DUF6285 domain-containing protein [Pseudorhodoferax sp. Leaf265]KQP06202.1 hypothetical protein ASF45_08960 [Pseudorhodoferax sp. Leaf265]
MIPPATALLQATADYLEHELLPTLDGYHRFQTRIAANVLRTALREAELAPAHDAAAGARLRALLQREGDTATLNRALHDAIASGAMPLHAPELVQHLRQSLREALAINNPRWTAHQHQHQHQGPEHATE